MKNAVIDFETYYDKDISVVNQGTPNYVAAADAYVVGVLVDGQAQCGTLAEMGELCANLAADPAVRPVAANSNFDQAWWEKYWPAFKQEWFCLLDLAAFNQHPRNLASLAGVVLGEKVDKKTRDVMKGVRYEDLPDEPSADSGLPSKNQVQEYCNNDCIKEAECLAKLPPMSLIEERIAAHTRAINRRGVAINVELVDSDKTKLEAMRFEAFKALPWHADFPPLSYQALARHCASRGIEVPKSLAKTDEECSDLMTDNAELAGLVGSMRRYRRSNTMLCKIESLKARVTEDGIMPLDMLYCGAPHTRRWSSKGFNIQNLDKEPLVTREVVTMPGGHPDNEVTKKETVWSRNWVVPRPGHLFLPLDYAQVEPRCLNWLAENNEMLDAMRKGYSVYEAFAMKSEGWRGEPGTIKEALGKKRYTLLKNRVLGLGYGMGSAKFEDYVRTNGGSITPEESKKIVAGFRVDNREIVKLWNRLDNLIANAARDKSHHLAMEMPSGDLLQYFNIRGTGGGHQGYVTKGDFGFTSKQNRLWGGTLTENVTQRMARDLLASAIVRLEEAGLRVAFTVHDEVILEIPIDSKEEAREEAIRIMTTPPEWAADLPLGVEGEFCTAYTK
jgi:DNA polymerase